MADGVIDSLSIEIGASATQAIQNINKLTASLQKLKEATGKGFSLGNFKNEIGKIGNAEYAKIDKLAKALQGLKGATISSKLGNSIADLAAGLDLLQQVHIEKLAKLGQSMQFLNGVKVSGYDKLPPAILNIAAAVDSITDDSIMRIHRLTLALSRLRGVDLSGLGTVLNAQRRGALGNTGAGGAGTGGTGGAGSPIISGQTGAQGASGAGSILGMIKGIPGPVAAVIGALQTVGNVLRTIGKIAHSVFNGIKRVVSGVVNVFKKLANTAKNVVSAIGKIGKNILNWGANQLGITRMEDNLKRVKKLVDSFGRVALYRAIRSSIKYITDALKEGTENAYWFSKLFGDATKYISEAYDQMASGSFKMSNQLGAAWSTLIATIQPIIMRIIDLVTRAANAVTQFFAVLGGKSTYMKAIDYSKDWADATDKGSKAAKEWKNQLMGFDEINRLEEPSSPSGGSGKKDYDDYENMFEESPVGDLIKQIRDLWNGGEFAKLGKLLGDKVNGMVNSVDWAGIGKKIGKNLNGVIVTAYNFLDTVNFKNIGAKIANLLNSAGDEINFNTLGRLFTRIRTALWDVLYGATVNLDWTAVAINLSDFILGAMQEMIAWLNSLNPKDVATAIKNFFGNIKYQEIGETFVTLIKTAWAQAVSLKEELFPDGLVVTVTQAIVDFFGKIEWQDVRAKIQSGLETIKETFSRVLDIIWPEEERGAFKDGLTGALSSGIKAAFDLIDWQALFNVFGYIMDRIIFGENHANRVWQRKGEYAGRDIVSGLSGGIVSNSTDVKTAWDAYIVNPTEEDLAILLANAKATGAEMSDDISRNMQDISGTVSTEASNISWNLDGVTNSAWQMAANGSAAMDDLNSSVYYSSSNIISNLATVRDAARDVWNWLNAVGERGQARINANAANGYSEYLTGFATGGFPEDGFFMANHGELVGKFSNGKTAVANNEQITAGIADAVYDAFMTAFTQTNGSGNSGQPVNIYLDGRMIAQSTTKYQKQFAKASGV